MYIVGCPFFPVRLASYNGVVLHAAADGSYGVECAVRVVPTQQRHHRQLLVRISVQGHVPAVGVVCVQARHLGRVSSISTVVFCYFVLCYIVVLCCFAMLCVTLVCCIAMCCSVALFEFKLIRSGG